jgi:enoyl-CoA hydratase/carnithine racemase
VIERDLTNTILTLRLAHGKASALDLELCQALQGELERAAENNDIRALLLTGTGSIFSAGVDLPRLVDSGQAYVKRFVVALEAMIRALFLFPKPAVAAINGHAIAGGAMLAFACDYRIMSAGRIGAPELLVGVPFPPLPLEIVRFAVPPQHLQSMIYLGRTIEAAEAKSMGIIDEVVAGDDLLVRGREIARQLGELAPEAFRIAKRQLREPFLRDAASDVDALWADTRTHDRIRAYIAKTFGKR